MTEGFDIWLFRLPLTGAANALVPVLLVLICWLLLVVLAWRRPQRRLLPLRLGLLTLAMGSLLLAALQPAREVPVDPGTAVLLTPGASVDLVDSLRRATMPDLLFAIDSSLASAFEPARHLSDIDYLRRQHPDIQRLHIAGHGLPAAALAALTGLEVQFYPADLPDGVVEFSYPREVYEGESITFSGYYKNGEDTGRRLFLESPNGKDLLLSVDSLGRYSFSFTLPARQPGKFLFHLVEETGRRRQLTRIPVPVLIRPAARMKVLILSDAPGFETRYLKNWLAGQGYGVAVRSTISRDRYRTEFNNLPEMNLANLSQRTLAGFDLLLLTAPLLRNWSPAQRATLRRAVEEGLGVVLLATGPLPALPAGDRAFFLDFPLRSGVPLFRLSGSAATVELEKAPYHLDQPFGLFPLGSSSTGKVIAGFRLRGQGRVALHLPVNTYRLLLAGKEEVYGRHWTTILEAVARQAKSRTRWEIDDPLPAAPGQPLTITAYTQAVAPVGTLAGPDPDTTAVALFLKQDPLIPERWTGRLWPKQEGWHRLSLQENPADSSWFFVPPPEAWQSLRAARHQENTRRWISQQPQVETTVPDKRKTTRQPYPLWWFYLLFVLAAGGLWLEEKW